MDLVSAVYITTVFFQQVHKDCKIFTYCRYNSKMSKSSLDKSYRNTKFIFRIKKGTIYCENFLSFIVFISNDWVIDVHNLYTPKERT